jgi:hypothetical protein
MSNVVLAGVPPPPVIALSIGDANAVVVVVAITELKPRLVVGIVLVLFVAVSYHPSGCIYQET